jgi:hypothetical protein
MPYTLATAAKAAGRNKSTILRAIKAGTVSAARDAGGGWAIEPAELHRVYPAVADAPANAGAGNGDAMTELRARLADKDAVIDDLRRRLDAEAEERRRLTAIIADQRAPRPGSTETERPASAWRWFLGWRR